MGAGHVGATRLAPHAALGLPVLPAVAVVSGDGAGVEAVCDDGGLAGVLWLVATSIYTVGKNVRQGI